MTKVLVVDDSAFMRMLVKDRIPSREKIQVLEASCGKEALEIIMKEKPDLILLDVILPDISGEEVLYTLRKAGITSKVILVTAVDQKEMLERKN